MEESEIPFLPQQAARGPAASEPTSNGVATARQAARLAAEVDRRLAREQPAPDLPPVSQPVPEPARAGSIPLPFYSSLNDPAGIASSRTLDMRQFRRRVVECVACEYRKLETRMGNPSKSGLDPRSLPRDQNAQHFGPGERDYTLCHICYDVNGTVHPSFYRRWVRGRGREDTQRTLRHDPRFAEIADRVAEVDRWRSGRRGEVNLAAYVTQGREPEAARDADLDSEPYDGFALDERVPQLSDFTEQTPGEGRSRFGNPDPEFARGAPYDAERFRIDEAEGRILDEAWEARRKENFRSAWEWTEDIDDPQLRRQARERLVQRWDPRMSLVGEDRMEMTNPFAEPRPRLAPYARDSVAHSGVDEGFSGESEWRKSALARHESAVAGFLESVRRKLAQQRVPAEKIAELTNLPDINPGREIGKLKAGPLHERVEPPVRWVVDPDRLGDLPAGRTPTQGEILAAIVPAERPTYLAPAAELDAIAREAAARQAVGRDVDHLMVLEAARGQTDPDTFVRMAERVRQRDAFQGEVRSADSIREEAGKLTASLARADGEIRAAVKGFATEIRSTFRDPKAFQESFSALEQDRKREVLRTLRESPATFHREFGSAGEMATKARGVERTARIERAGILTANAGERYLDAVRARDIARKHAARALGLPETTPLKEVRSACETRMAHAREQKGRVLASIDGLGRLPTRSELEQAFRGLTQEDRRRVMQQVPELTRLMETRSRGVARRGPSL